MSVKLVSINIEGSKHLEDKVLPYIKKENPDVITLQEVFKPDVKKIEEATGMNSYFVPLASVVDQDPDIEDRHVWGLLILTRLPIVGQGHDFYHRYHQDGRLPDFYSCDNPDQMDRALAWIKVSVDGGEMIFANTHFMWSQKGLTTPLQMKAYTEMEKIMDNLDIDVFTGDFNAPRGREIFSMLAKRYKDNMPSDLETSIDNKIHKAQEDINLMVDGLFSEQGIKITDVKVSTGVSDHKAISCLVDKE